MNSDKLRSYWYIQIFSVFTDIITLFSDFIYSFLSDLTLFYLHFIKNIFF